MNVPVGRQSSNLFSLWMVDHVPYFAVMFGNFREEVLKFEGTCLEEFVTKKPRERGPGEVLKFEGGGICPTSACVPYFIL